MTLWIIASACAFYIKGLCGFANTLVFTSVLAFGTENINISPVELILGYPTNLIIAYKERKSIKWSTCLPIAMLVIAGSIPGIWILKNVDSRIIKIICGIAIILIGIEALLREIQNNKDKENKNKENKFILMMIGILSGVLCGLYGIGALLGAYISRVTDNTSDFKANICVVFFLENTLRIVLYTMTGIITIGVLKKALFLMPVMVLALVLGMISSKFVNERIMKKIVQMLLILSGTALLFNNI